jgi:hypothetical protein
MPQLAARPGPPACGGFRCAADRDLRQQGLEPVHGRRSRRATGPRCSRGWPMSCSIRGW